jgi:hypothetical protein
VVDRGDPAVRCKVTVNIGAKISENGFARLVAEARKDTRLAALVNQRADIPAELLPFIKMSVT